jgi:hypothetical protein
VWDGTIEVDGATIERVATVAFDSPADGVLEQNPHRVRLRSRSTGDVDGVDLWLDQAQRGTIAFASEVGTVRADLATLGSTPVTVDLGGLDLHAMIRRYPENPTETALALRQQVFVKAVQVDGHMAWASPVYVD